MSRITTLTTPLGNNASGDAVLLFKQLDGCEGLSSLFDYTLTMLSNDADLTPDCLLGKPVTITIQDQHNQPRHLNAIVQHFHWTGREDRFHIYEAKLVPWLWLASRTSDCKIFQHKTAIEIVQDVLTEYPFKLVTRLSDKYQQRDYCVQYNETDLSFVSRLLEAEGVYYFFEHSADQHTLVLADYVGASRPVPGHAVIPFSAPSRLGIAKEEVIRQWVPHQAIKPGSHVTTDYDFHKPHANLESRRTDPKQHEHDRHEIYRWPGNYTEREHGQQIARVRLEQNQHRFATIEAQGNVRALTVGTTGALFTLQYHPHADYNREVLVLFTRTLIKENPYSTGADSPPDWRVSLVVAASEVQYRPDRLTSRPRTHGPQTAVVTGPGGNEYWTNEYGQVKVQFHWDRYGKRDENSSCWIRVASSWAGANWGEVMVPRIGQEVIIDFLDGNPDAPLIIGRVNNAAQMPNSFSHTGNLPGNQTLAGWKSKEHQGGRYNQLLFDDTTGEIRTQLESEHGKSQLNMGYLTHPRAGGKAAPRGDGFELRTDQWGALRAGKGLLLSTDGCASAIGGALSRDELVRCLEEALKLAHSLGDHAQAHQANASDPEPQEKLANAVRDWGHGSNAEEGINGGTPLLAVSSPAGIALATPKSTTIATGQHIDLVAEKNQHITAGQKMNLHAGQGISQFANHGGVKSIAHHGKHITQAQHDDIQITADQSVQVTASHGHVLVAADKHVTLTSGGGYIKIAGGNIEIHCPGHISLKSATYSYTGPTSMQANLPEFGKGDTGKRFVLRLGKTKTPAVGRKYKITLDDGQIIEGVSDKHGRTVLAQKEQMRIAAIEILENE